MGEASWSPNWRHFHPNENSLLSVPLHLTQSSPRGRQITQETSTNHTFSISLFIRCTLHGIRVNSQILALKTNRKQANKPFRLSSKLLSCLPLLPLLTLLITLKGSEVKILLIIRVDLCVFFIFSLQPEIQDWTQTKYQIQ